jgi:hypothetical protein
MIVLGTTDAHLQPSIIQMILEDAPQHVLVVR